MPNPRRTLAGAAVAALVFILLAVNVAILVLGRQTQRDAESLTAAVADCQAASGTCYTRNQERLAALIRQLNMANLYLVQCAKVTNTDSELEECVEQRFRAAGTSPLPAPQPTPATAQDDDKTP